MYALFRGITSSNKRSFYCLNCLHSCSTKDEKHENVCKNHDYCYDETSKEEKKLKHNHGEKSVKVMFIIYTDLESLLEKMNTCHNNLKKS